MIARWLVVVAVLALYVVLTLSPTPAIADQPRVTTGAATLLRDVTTLVGSATIAPGNFEAVRVLCPDGMVAVGGGVDLNNVLTMVVTSSAPTFAANNNRLIFQPDGANPAPVGWQASARNNDTGSHPFKVVVTCAPLEGVSTVVDSQTVAPDSFQASRALCPNGRVAVGGGVDLDNVLTMAVTSSAPTFAANNNRLIFQPDGDNPAPVGWQASARNNDAVTRPLKVVVICAQVEGVSTVVGSASVSAGSFNADRILCPNGSIAVGGGIDLDNVLTMVVTSSAPTFADNDNRLIFQPDGDNPAPVGWQSSARNNDSNARPLKNAVICAPSSNYGTFLPLIAREP
jgi:hypothetical protein